MISCLGCEIAYSDLDKPCPICNYVNETIIIDNKGPDDWTAVRDEPVTDEMLNFLDSDCEQQRIEAEKITYVVTDSTHILISK